MGYHYANAPTRSVDRVRQVVFQNFGPDPAGLPGNDDQVSLLASHSMLNPMLRCIRPQWERYWHSICSVCIQVCRSVRNATVCTQLIERVVPTTTQFLTLSPFLPTYTIHNSFLNTVTNVTVVGFDPKSVAVKIPNGAAAYVKSITVNGNLTESRCHFDFFDTFRVGGNITIEVTSDKTSVADCGGSLPESISTGGFASAR